jgi:aryl-alcohol dehydrogenase-like predicted oxidoreductase
MPHDLFIAMTATHHHSTTVFPSLSNDLVGDLGIGAWSWGNDFFWGNSISQDIEGTFASSLKGNVSFFDTAEIYASGRSEKYLGEFTVFLQQKPFIATKFFPFPWRIRDSSLIDAARHSMKRLKIDVIDLYQIHWPSPLKADNWVAALGKAVQSGIVKHAGVSNFNVAQTRTAHEQLAAENIPLLSNQVHYSLLRRGPEFSGLIDLCHSLKITIIAYSPLEQGILTGKYTPGNPPPGIRGRRYTSRWLSHIQPLIDLLREIGLAHGEKTPGQVAINWTICKGTIPIPGARNARQAQEIMGATGWQLTPDEVMQLDALSQNMSPAHTSS